MSFNRINDPFMKTSTYETSRVYYSAQVNFYRYSKDVGEKLINEWMVKIAKRNPSQFPKAYFHSNQSYLEWLPRKTLPFLMGLDGAGIVPASQKELSRLLNSPNVPDRTYWIGRLLMQLHNESYREVDFSFQIDEDRLKNYIIAIMAVRHVQSTNKWFLADGQETITTKNGEKVTVTNSAYSILLTKLEEQARANYILATGKEVKLGIDVISTLVNWLPVPQ